MNETTIAVPEQAVLTGRLFNNVGISVAREGGDALHSGIAMLRRAIGLNPLDLSHRANLAVFLVELGQDDEAEEICTFILKHQETNAYAWQVMGVVNTNRGRLQDAIACFRKAHSINPEHGQHKFDLAAALLRAGQFEEGLRLYEHRSEILPKTGAPPDAPLWKGEKTGHLAIWPDQGHGDLIMFARFVPWAKQRAEKVSFLVNPHVLSLFQGYASIPGIDVQCAYDPATKFDAQICLASLPLVYGLTPNNVPDDPGLVSPAAVQGTLPGQGLRIGIAWQGNPQFPGDRMRSIPFREFLPLAADPRNTVYSLQIGPAAADITKARAQRIVKDMSSDLEGEWSHTAALIKSLDLVVSSCTAIPHLAGALGVPTFLMIPLFADWRWLHGRDDTPWYPNTRLFRQTKVGDWTSVMSRVCAAVDDLHNRRALFAMLSKPAAAPVQDEYEPDVAAVMRKVLRPGDCFVDVGANAGIHTRLGAELVGKDGKVFAFEPGENVLPQLKEAVRNLPQVTVFKRVLGEVEGERTFYLNADNSGGNALWDPADWPGPHNPKSKEQKQPRTVNVGTIDRYPKVYAANPRLIKIDTEGAEQRVLEGAVALLFEKHPPFIVAELHEFGLGQLGCSQASLRDLMRRSGYETFLIFADGSKPKYVRPEERIESSRILNLLFARETDVDALWPEAEPQGNRPLYSYGLVGENYEPLKLTKMSAA